MVDHAYRTVDFLTQPVQITSVVHFHLAQTRLMPNFPSAERQ